MGHALSLGFLQFVVVLPASRGFIVGKVITDVLLLTHFYINMNIYCNNRLQPYHYLQLGLVSFACIEIAATIIEIIALFKFTEIRYYMYIEFVKIN